MSERFQRTELLIGDKALARLGACRVAVFGVGGVGGYTVEALARTGVGALDLVDKDVVDISNLNRQIIATESGIGRSKVELARERVLDINPECRVLAHQTFYLPETADEFDFTQYDYVVDAIDTVSGKLELIQRANDSGVPIISSMGAGNKLDPSGFMVADIYETDICPLAKVIRKECRKRGIEALRVVYSKETPLVPGDVRSEEEAGAGGASEESTKALPRKQTPGSVAFVPSVVGLIIASEVIKDLIATPLDKE